MEISPFGLFVVEPFLQVGEVEVVGVLELEKRGGLDEGVAYSRLRPLAMVRSKARW